MAIMKAYKAIGESKQRKMVAKCKKAGYQSRKKSEAARKKLCKKTCGF